MPETEWERKDREAAEEVAKKVMDTINIGASNAETIAKALMGHHRTLQQGFTRIVKHYLLLQADAYEKGWYDARNEDTCKWAKKLKDAGLLDVGFSYI